jgi:signal transduction histidine kinase
MIINLKTYFTFVILFFIFPQNSFAESTTKSLNQELAQILVTAEDAPKQTLNILTKIKKQQAPELEATTLLFLMKVYDQKKEDDKIAQIYKELNFITSKNNFHKLEAKALYILSRVEFRAENFEKVLSILENKVFPLAKEHALDILGVTYSFAADIAATQQNFVKHELFFNLAIAQLKIDNNIPLLAETLANRGSYLSIFGQIEAALPPLIQAVKYQLELDDKKGLFISYRALGRLNHEVGDFKSAITYFKKALALNIKAQSKLASLNYSMAFTYYELQEYDDALNHINNAENIIRKSANKRNLATILIGKASILVKKKDLDATLDTLNNALDLAKLIKSKRIDEDLYLSFAKYYLAAKDKLAAVKSLETSLAIESKRTSMTIDKYETAVDIYQKVGKFESALIYSQKLREIEIKKAKIKDEKRIVEQQNQIEVLTEQKNTAMVKQQLLLEQNQVQLQQAQQKQLWLYGLILIACLFGIFSFLYFRQTKKKHVALEQSKTVMALMEQKNHFIANVAHDLKNPLTVIQVHLEALKDGMVKSPDKAHEILNKRIGLLTHIIDDLRQVSLVEIGTLVLNKKLFEFSTWLQQEVIAYQPLIESNDLRIESTIEISTSTSILGDESRLSQVLANLIKNSIRYTCAGGKIIISAKQTVNHILIDIEDTSPCVGEIELERLFEQSYRSDKTKHMSSEGSGFGLYICKEIIEAHQGKISASLSDLGGLCITINLPLTAEL